MGVEFRGPRLPHYEFVVDGYRVPNVTAVPVDGGWNIIVDRRIALFVTDEDEIKRWLPLLANGMAVAAGYTKHGEGSAPMNPYRVQVREIGTTDGGGPDAADAASDYVDLLWPPED